MKKITCLLTLVVVFNFVKAQSPYNLPFQEMFVGVPSTVVYTTESLNDVISTPGWEIYGSIATPDPQPSPNPFGWKKPSVTNPCVVTLDEGGYILTPELNIPKGTPLEVSFMARMLLNDKGADNSEKIENNLLRNFYVTIGSDTIYDHHKMSYTIAKPLFQNPNRFMGTIIYEGDSPVRLKLFATNTLEGVWVDHPDGLSLLSSGAEPTDANTGMLIQENTTIPALNISLGHNIDLGTISLSEHPAGSIVNKSFELRGVNLTGNEITNDVVLSDDEAVHISLPTTIYTPVEGVVDEVVPVDITVPSESGTYKEKITLAANAIRMNNANTFNERPTRTIWFTYKVEGASGLNDTKVPVEVFASDGLVRINSPIMLDVTIYNLSGALVHAKKHVQTAQIALDKGVYLVKTGSQVTKVVL
ncbi:MAG: T9SS type A sorting domain-containing protein [Pigmentiphaga sp.]|nr:T9SS type A sorting domain-containing protein [Pigmentiphaga sp.]